MGCPIEFVMSPSGQACVVKCPATYTLQVQSGVPSCVMKSQTGDVIASFGLTSVPPMAGGGPSGAIRNTSYVNWGADFVSAYNDYTRDLATANAAAGVANQQAIAFSNLQAAENARGTPGGESAYEKARVAYYTLTQGDSWIEGEQERIANTEAQPVINGLVSRYTGLQEKRNQQQSTIEVINGLKDKVLSVKDDLAFSVDTFQKQVEAIKNQINIDRKNQADAVKATSSWIDVVLNWLIAIATLVCIILLVRRFLRARNPYETEYRNLRAQNTFLQKIFSQPAAPAARPA